ncbi:hypothetical protein [Granulosicoccus antarcticus]|uniref:FG-GAP repeat protein n=1 Tax=Granulosicoccus antarcticus IMCC3135 TaxID=1192854 RepID=A0A2Z2P5J5_9GAMM|nr:hypothetical protein [Granulosicoccus antarcticus]ASJ76780.1 hypothetical protein IMCC3135_33695 [Granulosicoccus antarcticus IMCC3135]
MKHLLKYKQYSLLLTLMLPGLYAGTLHADSFDYNASPESPNHVLLEPNLSFDGTELTYGHIYSSIYELADRDGDALPERAFMVSEPGISCLTLVYVPSTQLSQGDIDSSDLSAYARVRNIGYPYLSSDDSICQNSGPGLQSIEGDLHLESISDISGDGVPDFLINDFEYVGAILLKGDLVPGVVYDAADADAHVATTITTGYIGTVLEDIDQDGLGEISMEWYPDSEDSESERSCVVYAGGIGNFPANVDQQDFSAEQTLYLQSEEYCGYVQNLGDVNGDGVQDLSMNEARVDDNNSVTWVIHGGSYLQAEGSLMPDTFQQAANAYALEFDTVEGESASINIQSIGDFDADGYDDVRTNTLRKSMELALTAPGTDFYNNSSLILYGSAEGLPRDVSPGVLSTDQVSQIMGFEQLNKFTDVNNDGAADLTTDYPFSVYLGTPGDRFAFLLPNGTTSNENESYQLQGFEYGESFGELVWNQTKLFALVWQDGELVTRTETNSLMIPRDIAGGGTFKLTPDFLGKELGSSIMISDIREPLMGSNEVTLLSGEAVCNANDGDTSVAVAPQVAGLNVSWPTACAKTINVHRGDGSYLTTLPGDVTDWTATESGEFFFVSTNAGNWSSWQRSGVVSLNVN